jgi:hypothetical protein
MADRGTMAVLLADFLAAVGAITFGLLYAKVDLGYLLLLLGITFGLFFVVWGLLAQADVAREPKLGQRTSHRLRVALPLGI